ncbi:hypothetical protein AYO41_04725 [Verrucomicrobia bacterium SCGC AG-212-E04]|nr:hypothetical protein AYO41_04725 [Verrucomicrobia bacterium SCGC AG-212-E04]
MNALLHRRRFVIAVICAASAVLVWLLGALFVWPARLEMTFRDFVVQHGRVQPADPRLLFLAVDQESVSIDPLDLDHLYAAVPRESSDFQALSLMSGGWPFNREVYALATEKILQAGAAAVMIDFLFPKLADGDRALQAALERHGEKVTVVSNIVPPTADEGIALNVPTASVLPSGNSTKVLGYSNFFTDPRDGKVRSARFRFDFRAEGGSGPAREAGDVLSSLAARTAEKIGQGQLIPAGVRQVGIRFAGSAGTFKPIPLFQIFVPKYWKQNFGDGERLKGKIVMIGPYGNWSQDFQPTPWGPMPGPELHLNALNALLGSAFVADAPDWLALAGIILSAGLVFLLSFTHLPPVLRFLLAVAAGGLAVGASLYAYNHFNLYLPTTFPLLCLGSASLGTLFFEFTAERIERARTRRMFERYMSANVVRAVLDHPEFFNEAIRGVRKPVTILFSDIRGFTTLTESADSQALVTQLNEYLSEMVKCVFKYNGTLDKFVGDAVMAVWGNTPVTRGPRLDAIDAVRCGLEMIEVLARLNVRWKTEGRLELHIGIGINHGDVIVGNMGSPEKMEFTVIGDAVNTASRFEGLTKEYHIELIVGEAVASLVGDEFVLQDVGFNLPKGKTVPVQLFTVLGSRKDPATERSAGLAEYAGGLKRFRARDAAGAVAMLQQAATLRPEDPLVERYLGLANARLAEGADAKWEDVTVMNRK